MTLNELLINIFFSSFLQRNDKLALLGETSNTCHNDAKCRQNDVFIAESSIIAKGLAIGKVGGYDNKQKLL